MVHITILLLLLLLGIVGIRATVVGETYVNWIHHQQRKEDIWAGTSVVWPADIKYNFTTTYDGTDFITNFEIAFSSGLMVPESVPNSTTLFNSRALTAFGLHIPNENAYCSSGKNVDGDCYTDQELKDSSYPLHIAMSRTLLLSWNVRINEEGHYNDETYTHCMMSEVDAFCDSKSSCETFKAANPDFEAKFKQQLNQIGLHDELVNAGITVEEIVDRTAPQPVSRRMNKPLDVFVDDFYDGENVTAFSFYNSQYSVDVFRNELFTRLIQTYNMHNLVSFREGVWKKTYKGFKNGNLVSNTNSKYSVHNRYNPHRLFDTVGNKTSRIYTSIWSESYVIDNDYNYVCDDIVEHVTKIQRREFCSSPAKAGVTEQHDFFITSGVPTASPTRSPFTKTPTIANFDANHFYSAPSDNPVTYEPSFLFTGLFTVLSIVISASMVMASMSGYIVLSTNGNINYDLYKYHL